MKRSGGRNSRPMYMVCPANVESLDDALDAVAVHGPGDWANHVSALMPEWWAVSTPNEGIVAYFMDENEALSYRLKIIDRWLNG